MRNLVALALALSFLSFANQASACSATEPLPGGSLPPPPPRSYDVEIALAVAGGLDLAMIGVDIGYGADGRLLPEEAAVVQLGLAGANIVMSAVYGIAGLVMTGAGTCNTSENGLALGLGSLALASMASWMITHAIWSLGMLGDRLPAAAPSAVITPDGVQLGVVGRF